MKRCIRHSINSPLTSLTCTRRELSVRKKATVERQLDATIATFWEGERDTPHEQPERVHDAARMSMEAILAASEAKLVPLVCAASALASPGGTCFTRQTAAIAVEDWAALVGAANDRFYDEGNIHCSLTFDT